MTTDIMYNALLLLSCGIMTLGVVGIIRMPDIYTKLHGASKSVFLGVVMICVAESFISTPEMKMRLVLISLMVVLTTPLASHAIGHSAYVMHERMETPGAIDESKTLLDEQGQPVPEDPTWRL